MKKFLTFIISLLVVVIFILPAGCKKAEEPSKAPVPAPAPPPVPEQKPAEAPAPVPGKKATEAPAPSPKKKPSETPVTKQKAQEPSKVPAPAPVPEKKTTEAPTPPPKTEPEEDSIYIAQSTTTESDGLICMVGSDQAKITTAAIDDAKHRAVKQVITNINTQTKGSELKKALVSAYTNSTVGHVWILQRTCYNDDVKGLCCKVRLKAEVVPDIEKIKKLMKE
ncbi:MAG: hypothetical protein NTW44_03660 [Nitrospirae bacterium]|nr:hypothetical protein [Nitrospirota bacterium]